MISAFNLDSAHSKAGMWNLFTVNVGTNCGLSLAGRNNN